MPLYEHPHGLYHSPNKMRLFKSRILYVDVWLEDLIRWPKILFWKPLGGHHRKGQGRKEIKVIEIKPMIVIVVVYNLESTSNVMFVISH